MAKQKSARDAYNDALQRIEQCRRTGAFTLSLYGLGVESLPPEIGQLTSLTRLDATSNQLSSLPPEINQLVGLKELYLGNNKLTVLPELLGHFPDLHTLALNNNQLTALPSGIGRLSALRLLDLTSNQLGTLPTPLGQLGKLEHLYLQDNPGLGIPDEVLGPPRPQVQKQAKPKPPAEILEFYFSIAGEAGDLLQECKLIVVGRGGAGKTTLIKRLKGKEYDPHESETHGTTIQPLYFRGEKGYVTARVWDFGGQVVLHSMHEFFLTARSLYLLVLGERNDMLERDAEYWLQLIRSYAGASPVVVALNKSEGRKRQFDRATLEQKYGPILGWVSTECSERSDEQAGVSMLRQTLTAALDSDHMESVRRKFPKKWRAIKDELEGMKESYLDIKEFRERCCERGITDPKEQETIASVLHDLGVALNYGLFQHHRYTTVLRLSEAAGVTAFSTDNFDRQLESTSVLRPDWLANGIYAVLRANDCDSRLPAQLNTLLAPDAIVTVGLLALIHEKAESWGMLRVADYPPEKREFLLRLMEQFHLSYPLDEEGRRQLVPTLLPSHAPPDTEEPEGENRTRIRYEFPVVPAPLMLWFITQTYWLILNRLHWRRGAILAFGDARAKVWTTLDERFVFATVVGPEHHRQRLLAIIRGTLHEVFQAYKALSPIEQWEYKGHWVPREMLEEFGVLPQEVSEPEADGDNHGEEP